MSSDAKKLADARKELARVQREKPGDTAAYESANSAVVKAEKSVPLGRVRGWKS